MAKLRGSYAKRTPQQKARLCELCLTALARGRSLASFARLSGVPQATLATWMAEDAYFDRYTRVMEAKALLLPARADDILRRLIGPCTEDEALEAKVAGVALRHLEFRMMREHKGQMYKAQKIVENKPAVQDMTDEEIEARYADLVSRAGNPKTIN